jgi:acetolactate synthase-1/2/3 large subunit
MSEGITRDAHGDLNLKLSDYVAEFVAQQKIRHVFLVPGGGAMHLDDSFFHHEQLDCVSNLHEQACAMAAETYAKVTGGLGCVLVTTGPGGTNALTGLAGAWVDSTPCLFISGQAKRADLKGESGVRQMGPQEIDIVSMAAPVTKFATTVMDPSTIRRTLEEALHHAKSGRPGPVWIDIPLDVQAATIDPAALAPFEPPPQATNQSSKLSSAIDRVVELIGSAERPILLVGNGVRLARATDELHEFIRAIGIPSLATWLSCDLFDYDYELYIGKPGTVAPRGVNFALQNCDLLLALGARLDSTITGFAPDRLARGARRVMVDIDGAELAKLAPFIDIPIHSDARDFLRALLARGPNLAHPDWSEWVARCQDWKKIYPAVLPEHRSPDQKVSVYRLGEILSDELPEGQIIVSGSSGAGIEIFQHVLKLKAGQRLLHTAALGAMGYGLPAAIGACIASGGNSTVCVDGDGGLQLNIQELETVRRLNLPIKFFILSNEGYSSIRTSQSRWFGRLSGADASSGLTLPDIIKVASAYGLATARIEDQSDLRTEIRHVLDTAGPVVCEVVTIPDEQRIPSVASAQRADGSIFSKPIEDLWPFLSRDEFRANMIVPPVEE